MTQLQERLAVSSPISAPHLLMPAAEHLAFAGSFRIPAITKPFPVCGNMMPNCSFGPSFESRFFNTIEAPVGETTFDYYDFRGSYKPYDLMRERGYLNRHATIGQVKFLYISDELPSASGLLLTDRGRANVFCVRDHGGNPCFVGLIMGIGDMEPWGIFPYLEMQDARLNAGDRIFLVGP